MSTYNDIQLSSIWVDIYALVGGKDLTLQNKGSHPITVAFTEQAPTTLDGTFLNSGAKISIPASVTNIWARADSQYGNSRLGVENAGATYTSGIPSDLLTSPYAGTRRLAVDSQQTSFEENRQFRFFEDCSIQQWKNNFDNSVPSGSVLIYKFTTPNALNIQARLLNGWLGGRKYLVFPVDGNETITGGTFSDVTSLISVMNNSLADINPTHPTSGVTIQKRIATSFVSTTPPRTGIPYKSDSNQNRNTSSYSPQGDRAGVGAGSEFYLVLFDIASGATASEFMIEIAWEEIISLPQV